MGTPTLQPRHLCWHLCRDSQPVPRGPTHPPANHPPSGKPLLSLFPPPHSSSQPAIPEVVLSQGHSPSLQPLEVEALPAHLTHIHVSPELQAGARFLSRPPHTQPSAGHTLAGTTAQERPVNSRSLTAPCGHVAQRGQALLYLWGFREEGEEAC